MTIVLVVFAIIVVVGISLFAVGPSLRSPDDQPDREPADLPEDRSITGDDVDRVRFALGLRGYRMDQVDAVLDRAAADLRVRDERIEALEGALADAGLPLPPVPNVEATEAADDAEGVDGDVADDADEAPEALEVADPVADGHAEGRA
jgi:DivIVA domain-containing protein